MKKISSLSTGFCLFTNLSVRKVYRLDVSNIMETSLYGHLKVGNSRLKERIIGINSLYVTVGGKPTLPIMGESYFSCIRRDLREDRILKMKVCGINIISIYLLRNHYEEIEGQFEWGNKKDLCSFIKLCQKHGLLVVPGLGPWSHGEVRNDGVPDWILQKKYPKDRLNDAVYQNYIKRYFVRMTSRLKGFYYKSGGNTIGIQLGNGYRYGKKGEPHI